MRGTGPNDGPTLAEQIIAIVQFRIIQNPTLSASTLTTQLVNGLVNDGVISDSQATEIENAASKAIVIPTPTTSTLTSITSVAATPSGVLTPGEMITITVTVKPTSGTEIPTGKVTLSSPNSSATEVLTLDQSGKAVFKTLAPGAGTYMLLATYGGDSVFSASKSQAITATVSAVAIKTTTTLSEMPARKIIAGEPLTLAVQVRAVMGTHFPSGTVTLMSPNSTAAVVLTLDSTGRTIYRTKAPSAGVYSVYAVYNGNSVFAASVSPTLTRTVLPESGAAISSDENTRAGASPVKSSLLLALDAVFRPKPLLSGGGVALR